MMKINSEHDMDYILFSQIREMDAF